VVRFPLHDGSVVRFGFFFRGVIPNAARAVALPAYRPWVKRRMKSTKEPSVFRSARALLIASASSAFFRKTAASASTDSWRRAPSCAAVYGSLSKIV